MSELRVRRTIGVGMGEVAVVLRLMPVDSEVDLNLLEEAVKRCAKVRSVAREPIAFGLEALRVVAVVEDKAGGTEPLERELSSLQGVGSVQVISLTRVDTV